MCKGWSGRAQLLPWAAAHLAPVPVPFGGSRMLRPKAPSRHEAMRAPRAPSKLRRRNAVSPPRRTSSIWPAKGGSANGVCDGVRATTTFSPPSLPGRCLRSPPAEMSVLPLRMPHAISASIARGKKARSSALRPTCGANLRVKRWPGIGRGSRPCAVWSW